MVYLTAVTNCQLNSIEKIKNAGKIFVGRNEVIRAINRGKVSKVFIAIDAEMRVVKKLLDLADLQKIKVIRMGTVIELGEASKISRGASMVGIGKE